MTVRDKRRSRTRAHFLFWAVCASASVLGMGTARGQSSATTGQSQVDAGPLQPRAPVITTTPALVVDPAPLVPLAATITLSTDVPTRVSLLVDDGHRAFLIPDAEPDYKTDHAVLVLGLLSDRTNLIDVIVTARHGGQITGSTPVVYQTPPLPADFPTIDVHLVEPDEVEPGYRLFSPISSQGAHYGVMLDNQARVVWYRADTTAGSGSRLHNGNLLVTVNGVNSEVDMLGNVIQQWYPAALDGGAGAPPEATLVDADTMHHEFAEMPPGGDSDFVFLSTELRPYPDYPLDEFHINQTVDSANVVGDVIVEIRRDGTIVRQTKLLDILDPYRICHDNTMGFYDNRYGVSTRDWSHGNSVTYLAGDDTYLLSLRHQDCLVKIRRSPSGTGSPDDVVWILGDHDAWQFPWDAKLLDSTGVTPRRQAPRPVVNVEGALEWSYHTHAAVINQAGNVVCFDNGNWRAIPPSLWDPPTEWYSRAVEYQVDPVSMTVTQVWAAGGLLDPDRYRLGHSAVICNAEFQPVTGNVAIDVGARKDPGDNVAYVNLLELKHTDPPEPVMDITIGDPDGSVRWSSYRMTILPELYPRTGPVPDRLELFAAVRPGEGSVELLVRGDARPGETVLFAYSDGEGDEDMRWSEGRPSVGLPGAVRLLGSAVVGRTGSASLTAGVLPDCPSGAAVFLQAAILRGRNGQDLVMSNPIMTEVSPAVD